MCTFSRRIESKYVLTFHSTFSYPANIQHIKTAHWIGSSANSFFVVLFPSHKRKSPNKNVTLLKSSGKLRRKTKFNPSKQYQLDNGIKLGRKNRENSKELWLIGVKRLSVDAKATIAESIFLRRKILITAKVRSAVGVQIKTRKPPLSLCPSPSAPLPSK